MATRHTTPAMITDHQDSRPPPPAGRVFCFSTKDCPRCRTVPPGYRGTMGWSTALSLEPKWWCGVAWRGLSLIHI
eukprot:7421580-Prorocentrum_lima.AAC.1